MVEIGGTDTVYLACGATDMRKEIDGLAGLVEQHFKLDPFSRAMFVFCSKDKTSDRICNIVNIFSYFRKQQTEACFLI